MKTKICLLSLLLTMSLPVWGALYTYDSGTLNAAIPDNNTIGLTQTAGPGSYTPTFVAGGNNGSISALTLTFTLTGGDASDLSGYLRLGNTDTSPYYSFSSLSLGETTINFDNTAGFQSAFNGQNPNNTWTLFFADTVNGDVTKLNGWSLEVTAVPEPVNVALGVFGGVLVIWGVGRRLKARSAVTTDK